MICKIIGFAFLLSCFSSQDNASDSRMPFGPDTGSHMKTAGYGQPDHSMWLELLNKYVSEDGKVDYKSMVKEINKVKEYTGYLSDHPVLSGWNKPAQMAYWINAYNAFTIQLVLDNWPIKSIRDLHNGNPWDIKWIQIGKQKYSLNQIEHEILRPNFSDPRIHFVLNCAAKSCPPLSNQAFTEVNLEKMLNTLTKSFLNDPEFNHISTKKLVLSRIFDWYRKDFGDLIQFIDRYTEVSISPRAEISFQEYDWSLNQ